jgi:hypothetical protein
VTGSVAGVVVWNWSVQSAVQTILWIKERIMGETMNRTMDEITDTNEQPALTALVLVLVMGANALVTGVLDIAVAIRLRKTIEGEWLLIAAGIASIIFGILVFLFPGAGALALVWLISAYAIATGILLLGLAFRARGWGQRHRHVPTSAVPGHARA